MRLVYDLSIVFKPYILSTHREVVLILWVPDFQQQLGAVQFLQVQGSENWLLFPVTNLGYLKNSQKVFLAAAQFLESKGANTASKCSWVSLSRMPGLRLSSHGADRAADGDKGHVWGFLVTVQVLLEMGNFPCASTCCSQLSF